MAQRIIITREDEEKMHLQFTELLSRFRPEAGNLDDIRFLQRAKQACENHRLMVKHAGKKLEKFYRGRRYRSEKEAIPYLTYYYSSKEQKT